MSEHHPIGRAFAPGRGIDNGMAAVRLALGPMWLAGILMGISDGCNVPTQFPSLPSGDPKDSSSWLRLGDADAWRVAATGGSSISPEMLGWIVGIAAVAVLVGITVGAALFCFGSWVHTGFIRLHVNILEHASDAVAPLFSGKDRFWAMAGWKLVSGFALSAAFLVSAWPGALVAYVGYARDSDTMLVAGAVVGLLVALPVTAFVAFGGYLGDCAVVLEGASPVEALRRSWSLARGNRFALFWFALVCLAVQMVGALGILVCCVGIVFTMPLAIALTGFAKTESFLVFTRGSAPSANWSLWQRRGGGSRTGGVGASGAAAREPMRGWERDAPATPASAPIAAPPPRDPFYRAPDAAPPGAAVAPEPVRGWTPEPASADLYRPPTAPEPPPEPVRGWTPEPPSGATPAAPVTPPGWAPATPTYEPPAGAPPVGSRRKPGDPE